MFSLVRTLDSDYYCSYNFVVGQVFLIGDNIYKVIRVLQDVNNKHQIVLTNVLDENSLPTDLCFIPMSKRLVKSNTFRQWLLNNFNKVFNSFGISPGLLLSYIDTDRQDVEMLIYNYLQQDYDFDALSTVDKQNKINSLIDSLYTEYNSTMEGDV